MSELAVLQVVGSEPEALVLLALLRSDGIPGHRAEDELRGRGAPLAAPGPVGRVSEHQLDLALADCCILMQT
jgi:hypothetical protein